MNVFQSVVWSDCCFKKSPKRPGCLPLMSSHSNIFCSFYFVSSHFYFTVNVIVCAHVHVDKAVGDLQKLKKWQLKEAEI